MDFNLASGVWIEGRITDKQTGKGLTGTVAYFIQTNSPNQGMAGSLHVDERETMRSDADGHFRIVGLPGPGLVTFMAEGSEKYPRADAILKLDGSREKVSRIKSAYFFVTPENYNIVAEVDPPAGGGAHRPES